MADGTNGEDELCDKVYETAQPPVNFKSDVWTHFCFSMSRNDGREEGDTQAKQTRPDFNSHTTFF